MLPQPPPKASTVVTSTPSAAAQSGSALLLSASPCQSWRVAVFKAHSTDDLTILRAGMCPDCGAGVSRPMAACGACGLRFDNNLNDLPVARVAVHVAPPQPPPQDAPPPQQAWTPPPPPPAPPPAPSAPAIDPSTRGRPLSLDDIELLERGSVSVGENPLTDAEGPEVVNGAREPLLGSALARGAVVVMAEAAVVDDPLVLLGFPPVDSHVARAMINLRRGEAALVDDPQRLAVRAEPPPAVPPPAPAPVRAAPTAPPPHRGLTLEDIEALERPILLQQPHSFAELCDLEGCSDPLLGAALIRGATATMADAAVIDDPLVLLGYPAAVPRDIARAMINLRRGDAADVDDVERLLKRPAPVASTSAPVRRVDPEATSLLDQASIRVAAAAIERENANQARLNRPSTSVSGRGGVFSLDDT